MRDMALILFVLSLLPSSFYHPHIGLYLWTWFSYMSPHSFTWYSHDFRFVFVISGVTIAGMTLLKHIRWTVPFMAANVYVVLFTIWFSITTQFALNPSSATLEWYRSLKIMLMLWATLILINTRQRLETILLITTLSIAFFGFRGGIFTLIHGGQFRVHGPHTGFFWDNNAVGLAMALAIPLMRYFYMQSRFSVVRLFFAVSIFATILSTIATYSRGSVLGLLVGLMFLFMKTRNRFRWLLILLPVLYAIFQFMPPAWLDRMNSIAEYQEDRASTGRLVAWQTAINLAADRPILGGGFSTMTRQVFYKYSPDPTNFHDFHSIYFEVLGEQGYPGLILFLAYFITCYRYGTYIIRKTRDQPNLTWMRDMAAMLQVSFVSYAAAGTFLGMAYFDLPWHLATFMIILKILLEKELAAPSQQTPQKSNFQPIHDHKFSSIFDRPAGNM
ncbi:MAG: putative O-glycosylation ligase, exosortase A system-associated [Magnetococcales bacterium]|nr:putative O-glycosylation ligase, exosortase A system-associated [Magnetococcales bacterium]NGZ25975.1 putative O-glycosylation ligase, exosortase A system-associated [Magnetococcales bacterium]